MYLPAFPALGQALGASPGAVQATLSTYLVGLAAGQALYGPLADRLGRRPPLVAGLLVYTLASAGCAAAPRIDVLIALRFLQALGGSACLVIPRAVALGGAGLVITLLGVPETRPPSAAGPHATSAGLGDYARLLGDRRFLGFAATAGLAMAGMFAYIAESPFVLIELYDIPAEAYGWVFGSNAVALIAASQVNSILVGRWHPEAVLPRSLAIAALLGVGLVAATATTASLPLLLVLLFAYMGSRGFIQPNAVACALAHHPERAGSASALFGVLQFGGATAASVLVGTLHDGSARPMALVMGGSSLLALAAYVALARGRR